MVDATKGILGRRRTLEWEKRSVKLVFVFDTSTVLCAICAYGMWYLYIVYSGCGHLLGTSTKSSSLEPQNKVSRLKTDLHDTVF